MVAKNSLAFAALSVCLGASACLVDVNDKFGAAVSSDGTGGTDPAASTETGATSDCTPNGLDCDDFAGCESDRRDPETCGSCGHSCQIAGQWVECEMGSFECRGTITLPATADVFIYDTPPSHNSEGELVLEVSEDPLAHAFVAGPELALVPGLVEVEQAQLRVTSLDVSDSVLVHRVTEEWSVDMISWSTSPALTPTPEATIESGEGAVLTDVTAIVELWRTSAPNLGVALVPSPMGAATYLAQESGAGPSYELTVSW